MAQYAAERETAEAAAPAVANPAPLGLSAFALTTFVLSCANAGFFTAGAIFIGAAIFYGGTVQILAGLQEFKAGNTFGATAFCSYGGFWLSYGILLIPSFGILNGLTAAQINAAAAWFLVAWAIFTGYMFLCALRSNLALLSVFGLLFLAYVALAINAFIAGAAPVGAVKPGLVWLQIGGWIGIATALAAWYTAMAGVLSSSKSAFKLPVGPIA